ncbi:hypothetical protein FRACYDRAFT_212889 [Fragilariopsis cylindrus CCMP1102]|uniref:Fe2OG dioxygenase domain-containing protein n=1 Tax=Fragilariopsis cylindrus CCMP1102 TaxID=635003 RepID=A0A1E7EPW3_9STRA|nr:hypothetical protein FRACYDRAFT_212889 [Fragilariopsis cylindrus CCMP1102]|eukprot:OEU07971.1 hypothetical protein FRACYDRAFT_212889 [Fragilariopsis cylindrus CCMP1102]
MIRIISPTISGFGGRGVLPPVLPVLAIAFLSLMTVTTLLTTTTTTMFAVVNAAPATTKTTARNIKILNHSGAKVELYWIHPDTRVGSLMSTPHILSGADFALNSYMGHEFEVRELPSSKSGVCTQRLEDQTCGNGLFAVSENNDQLLTVTQGFEVEFLDDQIRAKLKAIAILDSCQTKAANNTMNTLTLMDCIQNGMTKTLAKANEEINFQTKIRTGMAEMMENYTCADLKLNTSESIRTDTWRGARDHKRRNVNVLLDRPASKIIVIDNFISEQECTAMANAAKPKLHQATVADGKGGSHMSEHRKAMQAGIKVPWSLENSNGNGNGNGSDIAILSRKVYDFTNYMLDLNINEYGQEDLMSIQYFGRGINDTQPDRYTPHCDGDCTGLPHKTGTRMATMVMYCNIPEVGGHTNFRNAGVHVKPKIGSAVFFSYIDPDTRITDTGLTEHSGCPVLEGEKKIVTQWIRLGVDDDSPWDAFNSLGLKYSDEDDD